MISSNACFLCATPRSTETLRRQVLLHDIASYQRHQSSLDGAKIGFAIILLAGCRVVRLSQRRQWSSVASHATVREQQVLPFVEPTTGTEVVLVACMHFNPQSIAKATAVTRNLSDAGLLASVVVESCPSRWEKIEELQGPGSLLHSLLENEMQAAADAGRGAKLVLGDERVEVVMQEMGSFGRMALADLASPLQGGWQRTAIDIFNGVSRLLDAGKQKRDSRPRLPWEQDEDRLNLNDFLDVKLLLGFPICFVRYVLSTALKAPLLFASVASYLTLFALLPENFLVDVSAVVTEVVLVRIILGALLQDRDLTLARSISDACKEARQGQSVVAILGAAHCNGVKRHLTDVTV